MQFAYADPPYLGCSKKHYSDHPNHGVFDTLEGHKELIDFLVKNYEDGWAYSCTSGNLKDILPLCPPGIRIAAWVKPFASYKPNVNPAYAWEPVIFYRGRKRGRESSTLKDWISANITMKKGTHGAKPREFCYWLFDLLGMLPEDSLYDIFPGSKSVSKHHAEWIKIKQIILN